MRAGALTEHIVECARCGRDHRYVTFKLLVNPVSHEGRLIATHWAPCPTYGDPILLIRTPEAD